MFVSGAAQSWPASSDVLEVAGDCPDGATMPDHRMVRALLDLPGSAPPPPSPTELKAQLLDRIRALEAELAQLKELVSRMN